MWVAATSREARTPFGRGASPDRPELAAGGSAALGLRPDAVSRLDVFPEGLTPQLNEELAMHLRRTAIIAAALCTLSASAGAFEVFDPLNTLEHSFLNGWRESIGA